MGWEFVQGSPFGTDENRGKKGQLHMSHVTRNHIFFKQLCLDLFRYWERPGGEHQNEAHEKAAKAHKCPKKQGLCFPAGGARIRLTLVYRSIGSCVLPRL